ITGLCPPSRDRKEAATSSPPASASDTLPEDESFYFLRDVPMKLHVGIAGVLWLAATSWGIAETKPAPRGDPRAAALMEAASKTRYTWSQDNTAVSGKIEWDKDGKSGAATFRDVFHQRGGLTFSPESGGEVPEEVREHVGSMISHRAPANPKSAKRPTPPSVIVVE